MNDRDVAGHGWETGVARAGLLTMAMAWGCAAGDRAELQGTVTVAGTAVEEGSIALVPVAGTSGRSAGAFIAAGRYRLGDREGVRPGRFLVQIAAVRKTGKMVENAAVPGTQMEEVADIIPPEYGHKSTLEVDIKPGVNTLDITIP